MRHFLIEEKSIETESEVTLGLINSFKNHNLGDLLNNLISLDIKAEYSLALTSSLVQGNSTLIFTVKVIPLLWDGKKAFTFILNDITHQETIMKLKLADINKDRVIASISHELRTPLNTILSLSKIIEKSKIPEHIHYYF